jgi:hypothetical protein
LRLLLLFFLLFSSCIIHAQSSASDTLSDQQLAVEDSIKEIIIDTAAVQKYTDLSSATSVFFDGGKPKWFDIEQERNVPNDGWIFFVLVFLLIVLTVLKLSFSNDFDAQIKSFVSSNMAAQLVRTSKDDISLSSFLMNTIFIITISVFTRFVLLHFYPYSILRNNFSIVALTFLFTFFSLTKYALLRFIGNIFEITAFVDAYLYNLSAITRTIGIAMIPILFMLYASSERYFVFIFILSIIILCAGVVMIVTRGLSTSYKLMYSSVYHFLLYICLCEILPIFLFIKLLTKTAI